MATATKPGTNAHTSPVRRARAKAGRPKPSPRAAKKKAEASAAMSVARHAKPGSGSVTGKLARKAAKKAAGTATKKTLKRAARTAVRASATLLQAAAELGRSTAENARWRPLPIQVAVDVAAPIDVVWEQWVSSDSLPEGVHRIEQIERDGDQLTGVIAGVGSSKWEAKVVDERECESFAWRSQEGTDCAGLATFHRITERLTRVELDLDVLPHKPAEALTLSLHVARRRAEADLSRFKARVEFISPDVYEGTGNHKSHASKKASNR